MKVLQVCLSRSWGGLEMVAKEQSVWLTSLGHEVSNLTLPNSPLSRELRENQQRIVDYRGLWPHFGLRKLISTLDVQLVIIQQLRDLNRIWHLLPKNTPTLGVLHMFLSVKKKDPWHRFLYGKLSKLLVLTTSQKDNALQHLPISDQRILIIPNGVDLDKFSPTCKDPCFKTSLGYGENDFLVGVVGRFDLQKGQLEALEALKLLKPHFPQLRMVFVGEDTKNSPGTESKMKTYIKAHNLGQEVSILPFQSKIENVLASLDAFLMPSYGETFGRVLIEAMASGVPSIATRAGGVVNIVEHGQDGILISPRSSEAIREGLQSLLEDPSLVDRLRHGSVEKVKNHFNLATIQRLTLDTYMNLAQPKN